VGEADCTLQSPINAWNKPKPKWLKEETSSIWGGSKTLSIEEKVLNPFFYWIVWRAENFLAHKIDALVALRRTRWKYQECKIKCYIKAISQSTNQSVIHSIIQSIECCTIFFTEFRYKNKRKLLLAVSNNTSNAALGHRRTVHYECRTLCEETLEAHKASFKVIKGYYNSRNQNNNRNKENKKLDYSNSNQSKVQKNELHLPLSKDFFKIVDEITNR